MRNLDLRFHRAGTERLLAVTDATYLHQVPADMFDLDVSRTEAEQRFARLVERTVPG